MLLSLPIASLAHVTLSPFLATDVWPMKVQVFQKVKLAIHLLLTRNAVKETQRL